jgi:hypothetical protein
MRHALLRLALSTAVLVGGSVAVSPAAHADTDAAVCGAAATWTYAPALGPAPVPATAVGGTMVLNCVGLDDGGPWTLPFAGASLEGCMVGTGTMAWGAASVGPEGPVTGGTFTYYRVGSHIVLSGTIFTPGPPIETHTLAAEMEWLPAPFPPPPCTPPTAAGVSTGPAVLTD